MKQTNCFLEDMLDFDLPESANDILWRACKPTSARICRGMVIFTVPFQAQKKGLSIAPDSETPRKTYEVVIRAYGNAGIA